MLEPFDIAKELIKNQLNSSNQYLLQIEKLNAVLSVHTVRGQQVLNQPWHYEIIFTSNNKQLTADVFLTQKARLTFQPQPTHLLSTQLSSLTQPTLPRTLHGVITEFSQLSVNKQQAQYKVILAPRLALLGLHRYSAIYQHQSVMAVVEQILRKHGFTGIDYRLELHDTYPMREFITQWQESDLEFIQRILADIGVWFCFETDSKHGCEVMVISDGEQGYNNHGTIVYQQPSGNVDSHIESIWDLQQHSKTVPQSVRVQDYNYREASNDMLAEVNSQPDDSTTHGTQYLYDQHYKQKGDKQTVETGAWYAQIRHQQHISQQLIITGKSNHYHLAPGQRIILSQHPLQANLNEGLIILSTKGHGNRTDSYLIEFTAIPFNLLKPYRPPVLPMPTISGTLPATITSPDNDTYGYIDTQGRYRVKFNFDLSNWKNGEESLWLRLAKPYAGETYGFHFPLIDGTGVAIAFTDGNPNRPYIAHALHDSDHPDHVSTANKHRNVIRTPANNKLRMDDKRGQEHIKLATEYGKTQLNLGHLVDSEKTKRGEGFELRTDQWGAVRAAKGIYLTTTAQEKAADQQLEMNDSVKQIQKSLDISCALIGSSKVAGAQPAEINEQQDLLSATQQLQKSTVVIHGEQGIAHTTPKSIQSAANENIIVTAGKHASINIFKKLSMAAGEMVSIFAHKLGIKLIAASGRVQIQAQSDEMELTSQKNMFITSSGGKVTINAQNELLLLSGGGGIRIKDGTIELIAPTSILQKTALLSYSGAESIKHVVPSFAKGSFARKFKLHFKGSPSQLLTNHPYRIYFSDGSTQEGVTDANGETPLIPMTELEQLKIEILEKD
jgi:type VI secretion system secreted protein VgrG